MTQGNISLRSLSDFWTEDKEILCAADSRYMPFSSLNIPSDLDRKIIQTLFSRLVMQPAGHFSTDKSSIENLLNTLRHDIERAWSEEMTELPRISLLSPPRYRREFRSFSLELYSFLGIDSSMVEEDIHVPSVALFPHNGVLLISEAYITKAELNDMSIITMLSWKPNVLEYYITQALSSALYAQIRGDWKDSKNTQATLSQGHAEYILPALINRTITSLAGKKYPQLALSVVHEKVTQMYNDCNALQQYQLIDALLRAGKTPAQIAMVSNIQVNQGKIVLSFSGDEIGKYTQREYFDHGKLFLN